MSTPPAADVIVVGGGPAGSTAAAVVARSGRNVVVLDAVAHPRPHVGESLLPGVIPVLDEIGALEAVRTAGFARKTGSTHFGWGTTPRWDLWFADSERYDHAWFVERDRFDALLLEHARRCGAHVRTRHPVRDVIWDGDRAVGVRLRDTELRAPLVVDASGQAAIIARTCGARQPIPGLRHHAQWAHVTGARPLASPRQCQALFVAQAQRWAWVFPMSSGRTSVGIVRLDRSEGRDLGPSDYDGALRSEGLLQVLGPDVQRVTEVRHERDWSYRVDPVSGPGFFAVGDAAGFIDPVLSTGVHLAMQTGMLAGRAAVRILDGADAGQHAAGYRQQHREMFDDLLRIVRFFYRRNLERDDYFWESKRILEAHGPALRPHKAFVVLTSGLVQNLALQRAADERDHRLVARLDSGGELGGGRDAPDRLEFVCLHLRHLSDRESAALYFVVEPRNEGAPALFRTRNWDLNCLAPRYDNDPIRVDAVADSLRGLAATFEALDVTDGEPLGEYWARCRGHIAQALSALPPHIETVRVFGE